MKKVEAICAALLFIGSSQGQLATPAKSTVQARAANSNVLVPQPKGRPVARVNGVVLTDRDLVREEYAIFPYARTHGGIPLGIEPDLRRGAMQMIIFEELVYQEAQRRNFIIPAADIERALADFRERFPSTDEYKSFLKTEYNNSSQVLRSRLKRSLTIDAFLRQQVEAKSEVSTAQAKFYYDTHLQQFKQPESYSIQSITILPPDNPTAAQMLEAQKRANDAYKRARATKSYDEFGLLAEKISEDNYKVMMGDHKSVPVNKLPPPVLQALKTLQPGQITQLLAFDGIFTVVRLNAHNSSRLQSFAEVKESLQTKLRQQRTEQLRSSLDKKLYAAAKVEELAPASFK